MREYTTRKPSCRPAYPLILLAGIEGAGKTWAAVEATTMEKVGRAFFIEVGESTADTYGAIPGAGFEIVEHDGTVQDIRGAVEWAVNQPAAEGTFNLLIFDSLSEYWALVTGNAQEEANRRGRGRKNSNGDYSITPELWKAAKDVYNGTMSQFRRFPGPVVLTSRLAYEMEVLDGKPSGNHVWTIKAEKNTGYNVQFVFQARKPRQWTMTKSVTVVPALQIEPGGEMPLADFSVKQLLETLGVEPNAPKNTHVDLVESGLFEPTKPQQQAPRQQQRRAPQQAQQPAPAAHNEPAHEQGNIPLKAGMDREKTVHAFAVGLEKAEFAGDIPALERLHGYATKFADRELVQMAAKVIARLQAAAAEQATQPPAPVEEPAPTQADAVEYVQDMLGGMVAN